MLSMQREIMPRFALGLSLDAFTTRYEQAHYVPVLCFLRP